MMWHLVLLFSLLPGFALAATASGKVTLADPATKRQDHSGVVVWLEPVAGKADLRPAAPPTMVHRHKTFVPHVLAISVGTKVAFPNRDPFFHNAFSNYDGQIFDIGLHAPGTTREFTFRRPGVVRVFCNIHPTMSAIIVVVDTPYFAISDEAGGYTMSDVAPGEYRMRVFHERVPAATLKEAERPVTVGNDPVTLPSISLAAAGYLEAPHKNKLGKDYPAVIKDLYPGQVQ